MPSTIRMAAWILVAPFWLTELPSAYAQVSDETDPLFQSHEAVAIRIKGPLTTLKRERSDEEDLQAKAIWQEPDGRTIEVDVGLRARGIYRRRRDTCPFPPVRLNFKTSAVKGTVFENQDKLKMVSHCKDRSGTYEQAVLREYLTYRMFNLFTDLSYMVRLVKITYEDTESNRKPYEAVSFIIEHKDRFTNRTGLPIVEIPRTYLSDLDPEYTNLTSVFQYMIGNTDFSPLRGAEGEDCCHNVNLFGNEDGPLFPVPYDYDMSGMIDAAYASPNPRFNLRNIRQRLYRGRCAYNEHLPATIQAFKDKREDLYGLIASDEYMSKSSRKKMTRYLDSFFKVIDNPKNVDRKLVRACVK